MSPRRDDAVLVTVLFTDIVASTEIAGELGDRRWRDLVRAHHGIVRRELKRFGGRELDTAGDGFFARFDRPADAVRCACVVSDAVRALGVEIRAGLHLGAAEVLEGKVGGITVSVGARVMGVGKGGEVLVSSTLRDALAGSGFEFADHGLHRLKGIEGEWRLYEVVAVDGARRSLPLSSDEARARRSLVPGRRVVTRGERFALTAAAAAVLLVLVAVAVLTDPFGEASSTPGPSKEVRALRALVPEAIRGSCATATSNPPHAVAGLECVLDESYTVTYSRFRSPDDMRSVFEGFAEPADPTRTDCARDRSARQEYTINSIPAGEVACYTVEGPSISTTDSVIVWTDDDLLVLARAVRGDAADRTLYDWWRTQPGPWPAGSTARPPRGEEGPEVLHGAFETAAEDRTLVFDDGRYLDSQYAYPGTAEPFFAKPSTLFIYHDQPPPSGARHCPNYEEYRWQLREGMLKLHLVSGECREYGSFEVDQAEWIRIA